MEKLLTHEPEDLSAHRGTAEPLDRTIVRSILGHASSVIGVVLFNLANLGASDEVTNTAKG